MPTIRVSVINASTAVADHEVQPVVTALQTQVSQHFATAWGIDATLTFVPTTGKPDPASWWLVILDNSDVAGALGSHDLTPQGTPLGKVFAGTDKQNGLSWSVTASHELLEMLADPDVNLTMFAQPDATTGKLYAYEVCDAVEDDSLGYAINGVTVSDFVFPAYFETFRTHGSTQFDFRQHLKDPVPAMLPGGYLSVFDVTASTGKHQITAQAEPGQAARSSRANRADLRARVGSRRERRRVPRDRWMHSEPQTIEPSKERFAQLAR
jgi:hypothetical protein